MTDLLKALQESYDFQVIMDDIWKMRPVIPDYVPQKTRDDTENLIKRIEYQSAMRQGFDTLYRVLAGKLKE